MDVNQVEVLNDIWHQAWQAYNDAQVRFDTPLNRGIFESSQDAETGRPWITRANQAATTLSMIRLYGRQLSRISPSLKPK